MFRLAMPVEKVVGCENPNQNIFRVVQRTSSSKHINKDIKSKMTFDPRKDEDLRRQREEIRREKELIKKLEEENRRRMVRLAQQEKAENERRRNGR